MRILCQPVINNNYSSAKSNTTKNKQFNETVSSGKTMSYPLGYSISVHNLNFTSMKKKEFSGVDAIVVNQYKPPIEKFNKELDLQNWAQEKCEEIFSENYGGRTKTTAAQRIAMIDEWKNYLEVENKEYNPTEKLLILKGVTKGLKPDNENIPLTLNKGVLADTIYNLKKDIKSEPIISFDFNKTYLKNLRAYYFEDEKTDNNFTGWIKIPSKENDANNFDKNVEKLKTLSHKSWCTKSNNAEPYLSQGDFHVYLENGQSKLGVRFIKDKIQEIQGEKNNSQIPLKYYDTFVEHLKNENLTGKLNDNAEYELKCAKKKKELADKVKDTLTKEIENKDYVSIYEYFGISAKENNDSKITLRYYNLPKTKDGIQLSDIGLSESELFKHVTKIQGNVNLEDSELTSFYNVKRVGGDINLHRAKLEDFGKLEEIGGGLVFNEIWDRPERAPKVSSLKHIKTIGGEFDSAISNITDLGELKSVGGDFFVKTANIISLKNLEYVGGSLNIDDTDILDIGNLKEVKGKICINKKQSELNIDWDKIGQVKIM